jgi:hypothetical protein
MFCKDLRECCQAADECVAENVLTNMVIGRLGQFQLFIYDLLVIMQA